MEEKQKRKKKTTKVYWPKELDNIIVKYNSSLDLDEREKIFIEYLNYPLNKLVENVINRFKFPYMGDTFEEIKKQVVSFLVVNLSKYSPEKGKSFSYFSVIAKNYLILHNNNGYKQEKRSLYFSDIEDEHHIPLEEIADTQDVVENNSEDFKEFTKLMINYWDGNITRVFKKKRDADIANAIIDLFRKADSIENFNKKALYLFIREMTGCKTSYITKVVNKMKKSVWEHINEFNSNGIIDDEENKFFKYDLKD